jgi:acyl-CoA thioester hydrolase
MSYRHEIRVRYAEVDMQKHVFNAHYATYVDDSSDTWFRQAIGTDYGNNLHDSGDGVAAAQGARAGSGGGFDVVLKRMEITWHGAATWGDLLAVDVEVRRWGTTSFDLGFEGSVDDSPVFSALVTYVSVDEGSTRPVPIPDFVRSALG